MTPQELNHAKRSLNGQKIIVAYWPDNTFTSRIVIGPITFDNITPERENNPSFDSPEGYVGVLPIMGRVEIGVLS